MHTAEIPSALGKQAFLQQRSQFSDVLVIGGGPAGLAAAIACAHRGLTVTVTDHRTPPLDKACGEAILPEGVRALEQLGVELPKAQSCAIAGVTLIDVDNPALSPVRASFSSPARALRRTVLHTALLRKAEQLGVGMIWHSEPSRVPSARYTVEATGLRSITARPSRTFHQRFGFRQHFRLAPWTDLVEVYWSAVGQLYVTPISDGEISVALLTGDPEMRLEHAMQRFPAVARRLRNASRSSEERAGITVSRWHRRVTFGSTAAIGDCAGAADAITGDGLSVAFRSAIHLADAIADNNLRIYERHHTRALARPFVLGEVLLALGRNPRLRARVFAAFNRSPELFARLLEVHIGSLSPIHFGVSNSIRLARALL